MEAANQKARGKTREIDDRLAEALRKREQLEARIAKLKSTKTTKDKRLEARRAFIVGQAILTHRSAHGATTWSLEKVLEEQVKKPTDRAVIADLLATG